MENDAVINTRETGVFYTPDILADYLADRLITKQSTEIFDPSYGEGALLLAGERIIKHNNITSIQLFGCDVKPVNGLLQHLPQANLVKENFLDYSIDHKFSDILMNPPYIRHRQADTAIIKKYSKDFPDFNLLHKTSDLWAYFLVKALHHLKISGNIGGIFPWAFLQADYAQPLRKLLTDKFETIEFVSLSNKYFLNTEERVIIIWFKNYGQKCTSIKFNSSKTLDKNISFSDLPIDIWNNKRVIHNNDIDVPSLLSKLHIELGFKEFKTYADTRIGVVTGADEFFILPHDKAKKLKFQRKNLIPIINSAKSLTTLSINASKTDNKLLSLNITDKKRFTNYLKLGIEKKYNERVHSKEREPWFSVKIGKFPDAFFPYRVSKIPFLVLSSKKMQSTNSIHRIYFKKLSVTQIKWLQVSFLSAFTQLSLEQLSKTYGRGMLKLEPGSLKQALVLVRNDKVINVIYEQIQLSLKKGDKVLAMIQATNFIKNYLDLHENFVSSIVKALSECQELRIR